MNYQTLDTEAFGEIEEKRSRFLAFVVPASLFEERLSALKAEHPKANHHVTAFRFIDKDNRMMEGAKDDGEPSGTSGMPILKLLIGRELADVGAIVVRYFGGTKLGTGGLARAYPGAVKAALEGAELRAWTRTVQATLKANFAKASDLEAKIALRPVSILDRRFTEEGVSIDVEGPEAEVLALSES